MDIQALNDIFTTDFNIDSIISVHQSWDRDTRFNYLENPRRSHGLFLLTDGDEVSLRAAEANGDKPGADAFLLTAFPTDWDTAQRMLPILSVVDRVGLSLLGVVPPLPNGLSGIVGGRCTRARAYIRALENITDRFLGKNTPLLSGVPLAGIGRRRLLTRGE